ncbi:hypothetical protein M2401_006904 [Pseudomonas sp. JUb42]|uniref:DUF3304 domain-containing protein n=1 Tax=Pseudomonas sp. JUb42 TaxID=2940611 RepID=UPI002169654E|nr:DUF3304 domain-containing protein [Pseudomonas sp. JUb42]MCS3473136.1 hypothetical protein [Pseudomonas sp. JUb42]
MHGLDSLQRHPAQEARPAHRLSPWQRLLVPLCAVAAAALAQSARASTIGGINHTHWAINHFSVNGRSALDIIGPYQGGGGGCCYIAPKRWQPGMTVRVDWETGAGSSKGYPGTGDWAKFSEWREKIRAQKRQLRKVVSVPDYTDQEVCGITVHFLPCDELEVTTSCYAYGSPQYPIKTPLELPEPQSCPQ